MICYIHQWQPVEDMAFLKRFEDVLPKITYSKQVILSGITQIHV